MSRIVLVQPEAGERLSGGYLYNARMAAHGAWETASVAPGRLEQTLAEIADALVLADSLWLAPATIAPFLALAGRGAPLAFVLHSFPSMIAAAESGQPPRAAPSAFELEALERVGRALVPGPHYRDMLRARRVAVTMCSPGIDDAWRTPPTFGRAGALPPASAEAPGGPPSAGFASLTGALGAADSERARAGGAACRLVSIGAVTPRKGFRDVLEALRGLGRHDVHWTVIGSLDVDAAYVQALRALAADFPNVALVGQQQPDVVRELLVASDLLVMPSHDENHPLVLLEAMAASVPAVAYDAGAAARMLGHGARGLVSPIGDRAALARNLTRLIDDDAQRARMAHACWRWQRRLPSWASAAAAARSALLAWSSP